MQQGGEITAGSATFRSAADIAVTAARVANHEVVSAKRQGWEIDSVVHHAALVAAGLELTVLAGGDVTVAGSKLISGGDALIAAGGDVSVVAAVDTFSLRGWTKKKSSSSEGTLETIRHQGPKSPAPAAASRSGPATI